MNYKRFTLGFTSAVLITSLTFNLAHAGLLDENAYINDQTNKQYWTNNDLSLDIMRLSYSDLLNIDGSSSGEQASIETVNTWLANQNEWRWASDTDFAGIYNWFDTDSQNDGWSEGQNIGSNLFFALNGTGDRHSEINNFGYDRDGRNTWTMVSYTETAKQEWLDNRMRYGAIANYCDELVDMGCKTGLGKTINEGWHRKSLGFLPQFISNQKIAFISRDEAALIVRNVTTVSEPSTAAILVLSLLGLTNRRFNKQKQLRK